jgi:spermidine/putrescine transport system ATP-binding protein
MSGDTPILMEARRVSRRFGAHPAVDDVTLGVRAGEFLTLLGPSGCGKTTLLRMFGGFETPDSGSVLLEGADITRVPPYRRDVNQVFQSYALFPHLSVRDNVAFGLRMRRVPGPELSRRVAETVEMVSLGGLEDRLPSQLSGGQCQRVALARAIVCRPKVLLLDEPLSALDAKLRRAMQLELKRLQRRLGLTFVFVTHDQEEALTMSDRIAIMNRGRIEQLGEAAEVYHRPATPFAADFLGQANLLEATVAGREEGAARVSLADGSELLVGSLPGEATSVLVSIRPEKVLVSLESLGGPNVLRARVQEEVFKGAMDQLLLATPGGVRIQALSANASSLRQGVHAGDEVYVTLHPDDLVVLNRAP